MRRLLSLLIVAPLLGGCLFSSPDNAPPITSCDSPRGNEGVVSIRWTIAGQTPSTTSCQGVARMQLVTANDCGLGGIISPIPCAIDKVRFDQQPYGDLTLRLEAIGTSEQLLYSGTIAYEATSSPPSTPALIELW